MKSINALLLFIAVFFLIAPDLMADNKPDFTNPEEVLADFRSKVDACSKAGDKCSVPCGYGMKTVKNFLKSNPGGDPGILKQRWQPCYEAFRDAGLKSSAGLNIICIVQCLADKFFFNAIEDVGQCKVFRYKLIEVQSGTPFMRRNHIT